MGGNNNIVIFVSKEFSIDQIENQIVTSSDSDFRFEFWEEEWKETGKYYWDCFNIYFKNIHEYPAIASWEFIQLDIHFYSPNRDRRSNMIQINCYLPSVQSFFVCDDDIQSSIYEFIKKYVPQVELMVFYIDHPGIDLSDLRKIYDKEGIDSKWFNSNGYVVFHEGKKEQ